MKNLIVVFFLLFAVTMFGQRTIEADIGEYVPAENHGGKPELKRFLQQEMQYPAPAYKNKTQGTVELVFAVDSKTGLTSQIKVVKSVSKELDAEAIRLYKLLLFKPSAYKGSKVTTYCSLKMKFSIKTYDKYCKRRGYQSVELENPQFDYSNEIYTSKKVDLSPKVVFDDTLMTVGNFISRNLKYPKGTLELNIKGVVKFSFIVEPSGRITNINPVKVLGGGATKEAERILKLLNWEAGMEDGRYVRVAKEFEVNFNLSNDSGFNYVPGQM